MLSFLSKTKLYEKNYRKNRPQVSINQDRKLDDDTCMFITQSTKKKKTFMERKGERQ